MNWTYRASRFICCILAFRSLSVVSSRSWRDVEQIHSTTVPDISARFYRHLEELAYKGELESQEGLMAAPMTPMSNRMPTTNRPSPAPSTTPSMPPTHTPTTSPTPYPTTAPTFSPTQQPSDDPFRENKVPKVPKSGYFNYEQGPAAAFGPGQLQLKRNGAFFQLDQEDNNWGKVVIGSENYWAEFTASGFGPWRDVLDIHQPLRNQCAVGTLQSPIDVKENGGICREHHEVRSLPGDFGVRGSHVEKRIESNKLRLIYERRPCADLENVACQEPDPPHADFPQGWRDFADVTHVDFKVPSEHTIEGERFDAEMQVFHIHKLRRRVAAQSVVIRARKNGYNYYLQEALDAFQKEFDKNFYRCRRRLLDRNLTEAPFSDYQNWAKFYTFGGYQEPWKRGYFQGGSWDPHHPQLIPTIHFFRYDGSLTEPPCGEYVTWWVADSPMIVGLEQLEQMKQLLFLNVNDQCERTSVHNERSVARPVQKTNNRAVWKCKQSDFGAD